MVKLIESRIKTNEEFEEIKIKFRKKKLIETLKEYKRQNPQTYMIKNKYGQNFRDPEFKALMEV